MDILAFLVGEWDGQEQIVPSAWGAGGPAQAMISARWDFGQRIVIQDYTAEREGKPWLAAHAVFTYNAQDDLFAMFWFDSLGFTPAQPAPGFWDGTSLVFVRTSPRGQTRHTYTPIDSRTYSFALHTSFDGGTTWLDVMEGRYTRRLDR